MFLLIVLLLHVACDVTVHVWKEGPCLDGLNRDLWSVKIRLRQGYIYAWTWTQAIYGDIIRPSLLTLHHPNPLSLLSPGNCDIHLGREKGEEHHRRFQAATTQAFERIKVALRNNIVLSLVSCLHLVITTLPNLEYKDQGDPPSSTLHQWSSNSLHNNIEQVFVGGHVPAAGLPFYSSVDGTGPPIFISRSLKLGDCNSTTHTHTRGLYASAWCFPIINTVHRVQWLQTTVLAPYQARYLLTENSCCHNGGDITIINSIVLKRSYDAGPIYPIGSLYNIVFPGVFGFDTVDKGSKRQGVDTPEVAQDVRIDCNSHEIGVAINTKSGAFNGMIYPKGLSKNSSCMSEFVHQRSPVRYRLPLRSCNTMSTELGEWKTISEKPLSTPDRDSNLDLPIIGSLVCCESSSLDHAAIEVAHEKTSPQRSSVDLARMTSLAVQVQVVHCKTSEVLFTLHSFVANLR
uniref:ZP domain-containing protein n=1 Tax=Timema bartmani TaxID=61472 RepID=A0A7R9ETP6_9NEOP|nr:unnamed protein product [Timema bartmani]